MKKIILIIMLMLVVGCNNDIVEPEERVGNVEYVVNGEGGNVKFSCKGGEGIVINNDSVELPYTISLYKFIGDELSCAIFSPNLQNYNNISIDIYYNDELVYTAIPGVSAIKLKAIHFLD